MTDRLAEILASLAAPGLSLRDARSAVPDRPGLYAIHAPTHVWQALGCVPHVLGMPLYVGKAEASLNSRDIRTHFSAGRTGQSTLRRSLAALLRDDLGLVAVPRNLERPDGSSSFALASPGDERLSDWMAGNLGIAVWEKPEGVVLDQVETQVVRHWRPPLNLTKTGERRDRVKAARRQMAEQARAWSERSGAVLPASSDYPAADTSTT